MKDMTSIKPSLTLLRWLAGAATLTGLVTAAAAQFGGGYRYQTGQELYEHICQGCHMPDAKGATGAGTYPALAANAKLEAAAYPALVLLKGQKAMPSFSDLNDAQVAEVVNYIRTNFGNHYSDKVSPDDVKALRPMAVTQNAGRPG